jgi:hypothetical protein
MGYERFSSEIFFAPLPGPVGDLRHALRRFALPRTEIFLLIQAPSFADRRGRNHEAIAAFWQEIVAISDLQL